MITIDGSQGEGGGQILRTALAREPKAGVNTDRPRLGFGDGSFAYETLAPTSWHFWPKMTAAGLRECWKNRPIGGEVRPEVQDSMWDDTPGTPAGQGFDLCVTTTHASWMLNRGRRRPTSETRGMQSFTRG